MMKARAVRKKSRRGFTLAELLVAIVIVSLLSLCIFLITQSASNTFLRGEQVITADDVKDIVLEYITQTVKSSTSMYLVRDIERFGAEYTEKGNCLYAAPDGMVYILPVDEDGNIEFEDEHGTRSEFGNGRVVPLPREDNLLLRASSYESHTVSMWFEAISNAEGKDTSLKVNVEVMRGGEVRASGSTVITLLNISQRKTEIMFAEGDAADDVYDRYYYCFFA